MAATTQVFWLLRGRAINNPDSRVHFSLCLLDDWTVLELAHGFRNPCHEN